MKYLPLIWYGIWRKRGRTFLILFQIMIAFVLFGLLQGMKSGMDQAISSVKANLLLTTAEGGGAPMPLAHQARIEKVPGVKLVVVQNFLFGTYQKPTQQILAMATNPQPDWLAPESDIKVTQADIDAMNKTRTGALASVELVKKYGWKIGDRIPLQSRQPKQDGTTAWAFDLVGTFQQRDRTLGMDNAIVINNSYFDEARARDRGTAARYVVVIDDPKQVDSVSQAIDQLFVNSANETRTQSLREYMKSTVQSIGDIDFVVRSVMGAVFFSLLVATGAMMMQSIRERTPELAVFKTLGYTDNLILIFVLFETLLLTAFAAVPGLLIARLILPAAGKFIPGMAMPNSVLLAGFAIAFMFALTIASLPAWRARQLQVVAALAGR